MSRPNLSNIKDSMAFLEINGNQPERDEVAAFAQWQAALRDWGGVVEEEDISEAEKDALAYVAQHIGFGINVYL